MSGACQRWQGNLAMAAIGRPGLGTRLLLRGHLARCRACREQLAELQAVTSALKLADPSRVASPSLTQRGDPSPSQPAPAGKAGETSLRRVGWALGGLVGVVAVAAGTLVWFHLTASPRDIALHGSQGVQASATLTAEAWGTDLSLRVMGQPAGNVYRVALESDSGTWWQAGSYRSERGDMDVHLACGVSPLKIDRIWVENAAGRIVLSAAV
jgi:hypothetical protein